MGKVFSLEQLEDKTNKVPNLQDFEYAVEDFSEAVEAEITNGFISGAAIYGSVAIHAYTVRSDFDCMIVPYDHSSQSLEAVARVIDYTNSTGRLQVSAITHPRPRLESGAHEIDRYFGDHLAGPSRIVFGEDPAEYITFPDYGGATTLLSYLRHKKRSICVTAKQDPSDAYMAMQRILELPAAIGRKALLVVDELDGSSFAALDSANKAVVVPASLSLFDYFNLGDVPREIISLDKTYSELLERMLHGSISELDYVDILNEIESRASPASIWLDKLDDALSGYLLS